MGNSGDKILPVHTCKRKLANDFSAFFTNKILNIRSELGLTDTHTFAYMVYMIALKLFRRDEYKSQW